MEKLTMQTTNVVDENIKRIGEMFPNCLTERLGDDGKPETAIDFDQLRQELSKDIVEGPDERYQFTWPDKRNAIRLANTPTTDTLRPCREESVDFDNTQNLYIEGDNLQVLKLLRENYLGKVKMIYIDPPYNTGNDFVYNDDFDIDRYEYIHNSGQYDQEGKRLVPNTESNGRFHTDWLNMIYPRLKVAKDLLSEDGVIFISIGDEEVDNLRKVANEIFGECNFRNQIAIRRGAKSVQAQFDTWDKLGRDFEYILFYTKCNTYRFPKQNRKTNDVVSPTWNNHWRGTDRPTMRYSLLGVMPESGQWRWSKERSELAVENYKRAVRDIGKTNPSDIELDIWIKKQKVGTDLLRLSSKGKPEHFIQSTNETLLNSSWMDLLVGASSEITKLFETKVFDTAKLTQIITRMLKFCPDNSLVLDFFSGSATTAHAVMQLNAEDGGKRKFIMVQLPEETDEKSEARKAGYKNICEIGKERIRRVGKKIKEEHPEAKDLDIGFRVLKLDSSNMKDVFYTPSKVTQTNLFDSAENIKEDRLENDGEDLLFQVMIELGISLSAKIKKETVAGKAVWNVDNGYLMACFAKDLDEGVITDIAKQKPYYFVMRDAGLANDNVADNFDQLFKYYSPETIRRII